MARKKLTPEDVRWGYRLLLEREPESIDMIKGMIAAHEYVESFIESILQSEEYNARKRRPR
jgi:hypothetical protein